LFKIFHGIILILTKKNRTKASKNLFVAIKARRYRRNGANNYKKVLLKSNAFALA
jgi:hypothetical protein